MVVENVALVDGQDDSVAGNTEGKWNAEAKSECLDAQSGAI
jgi:hypothetical protein